MHSFKELHLSKPIHGFIQRTIFFTTNNGFVNRTASFKTNRCIRPKVIIVQNKYMDSFKEYHRSTYTWIRSKNTIVPNLYVDSFKELHRSKPIRGFVQRTPPFKINTWIRSRNSNVHEPHARTSSPCLYFTLGLVNTLVY